MLKSMTGFGKAVCQHKTKKFTIEIKSLNSKQLDLNTKIPNYYKEKELKIRTFLANNLSRGKVEIFMYYDLIDVENKNTLNKEIIKDYYRQLKTINDELGFTASPELLLSVLRYPDTLKVEHAEIDDEEWKKVEAAIHDAVKQLIAFRDQEGAALEKDISSRISMIENLLIEVEKFDSDRIKHIKERLHNNLEEFIGVDKIDKNRFEQEIIYYIEKFDITEEKVRLKNHCKYFFETLNESDTLGKKLGFIAQEIGREINTIGSKANNSDVQQIVVKMKDELEKIKEQLMNVL